jgi:2-dehydro-3-deoxygluconokinase
VAQALARWHQPVRYISALPDNFLSASITRGLGDTGIDLSRMETREGRVGIYYLSQGADMKQADVIYDRAESAFSSMKTGEVDWAQSLEGCNWLHVSAISPGLSEQASQVQLEAVRFAYENGMTVSIDLNYRSRLWKYGKRPAEIMRQIMPYCTVVMGNLWAVSDLVDLPCPISGSAGHSDEEMVEAAQQSMTALADQFPGLRNIAYTFRLDGRYFGVFTDQGALYVSGKFHQDRVIDRVGSGDCFMAGLIHGIQNEWPGKMTVQFAASAAVGKMMEIGDCTKQDIRTIKDRMEMYAG